MIFRKKIVGIFLSILLGLIPCGKVYAGTLTSDEHTQYYHENIDQGFMNDIQSIWQDQSGYYHIYYLYNKDYRHAGDGTEWYHVKTKDFINYDKLGVALPKFKNGWGSVATGSIIKNTNSFFKDLSKTAIVAYFTSYINNVQKQYAAYSLDEGATYIPYADSSIMSAPGPDVDFRDPYVFFNNDTQKLTMYLAEKDKIGVYSSSDGKNFEYQGATSLSEQALGEKDFGTIECPVLKTMYDKNNRLNKEVLFFGGNGYQYGKTSGSFYMVGHLDNKGIFVPEQNPKAVDDGTDYYASNYLQTNNNQDIISLGWIGNWGYSAKKMVDSNNKYSYKLGSFSLAHKLNLVSQNGHYELETTLIKPTQKFTNKNKKKIYTSTLSKNEEGYYDLLNEHRPINQNVYLQMNNQKDGKVCGHVCVTVKQSDGEINLDYNSDNGYYSVSRKTNIFRDNDANNEYSKTHVEQSGVINPEVFKLNLLVDKVSTEIDFENSGKTYTLAKYSNDDSMDIIVKTNNDNDLFYTMSDINK